MITCSENIMPRGGLGRRLCSRWGWHATTEGLKCTQHDKMLLRRLEQRLLALEEFERAYPGGVAEFERQAQP